MFYDPRLPGSHGLPHDPITALVVPRPIGWISTISKTGVVNLAPYSYFNLVAGKPPFVMFSSEPAKDSQRNAESIGSFVFNLATWDNRSVMNQSSASLPPDVSEPDMIGIPMTPSRLVAPPRVANAPVALECRYTKTVPLEASDGTIAMATMVIGEVVGVHVADEMIVNGRIDIARLKPLARLGYFDYCVVEETFEMLWAKA
jgi:flavin reductase (DIM6/NTAB) family NADH-FMN oxidoreductase RutF